MRKQSGTMMMLRALISLSERTIEEVLNLERICIDHDNLKGSTFLDSSLNFDPRIKSFYLLYKNNKLISVLSMFIPSKHEAEITAYTLPKYRRKGYFKLLLARAIDELKIFDVPKILFVCESSSISGKGVIAAIKANYDHTEYFMRFARGNYTPMNMYRSRLLKVELKDLERAIVANMTVFDDNYEESKSLIINRFKLGKREQFLAVFNNKTIGLVALNLEEEDVLIFGFGIVPEYRGKGYGKELLHLIIDNLLRSGRSDITIEVNSDNVKALELYRKVGFQIDVAYEYYRIEIAANKAGILTLT